MSVETTAGHQPEEMRRGSVIRRRRKRGEKQEAISATAIFLDRYGDPSRRERGFTEGIFKRILGRPDVESIDAVAQKEGIVNRVPVRGGKEILALKLSQEKKGTIDNAALERYMAIVRENQGSEFRSPINPEKKFPHDLRSAIVRLLGYQDDEPERIVYFSCVDTALTHSKGLRVDGFFDIDGTIVTFSVSTKTKEEAINYSDVFISEKDISLIHELSLDVEEASSERGQLALEAYNEQVETIAKRFVRVIQQLERRAA